MKMRFFLVLVIALLPLGPTAGAAEEASRMIRLDVVVAAGGTPLRDPARLEIRPLENGRAGAVVARRDSVPTEVALAQGRYQATIAYRETRVRRTFAVNGEPRQRHVFNLRAGRIRLSLLNGPDLKALTRPVDWNVLTYGRDKQGRRLRVASATASQPEFLLSAGYYVVHAQVDGTEVTHSVEVTAGRSYDYAISLN